MQPEGQLFDGRFVGHVPGTTYGVGVDPHLAVTHNTAILGILEWARRILHGELIRRALVAEIKVVVLDITGHYARHFDDVCSSETEDSIARGIETQISGDVRTAKCEMRSR